MSRFTDQNGAGYFPAQDFDEKVGGKANVLGQKLLFHASRVTRKEREDLGFEDHTKERTGPITGLHIWTSKAFRAQPPVWSWAFPVGVEKDSGGSGKGSSTGDQYKLARGPEWEKLDDRWGPETSPKTPLETQYPGGWPFVSLQGSEENKQNNLLLPGFVGLVTPHCDGKPELGTTVFDLDDKDNLDTSRAAKLQSLCRVYATPDKTKCFSFGKAGAHGLAIQLGLARGDFPGYGIVADRANSFFVPRGPVISVAGARQVLAALSVHAGGFIDVGDEKDQHELGTTEDKKREKVNSAHISTRGKFRGPGGDAPIDFEVEAWVPPFGGPYYTLTHLRNDKASMHPWVCGPRKGLWRLETESFLRIVDEPPPLDDPPPRLPPRVPPRGPRVPPRQDPPPPGDGLGLPGNDTGPERRPGAGGLASLFSKRRIIGSNAPRNAPIVGTELEMGFASLVGLPQHYAKSKTDLRYAARSKDSFREAKKRGDLQRPSTIRADFYGAQDGVNWKYSTRPGRGRNTGGIAAGGVVYMPANYGLELLNATNLPSAAATPYVVMWKSCLAFGTPLLTGANAGGVKDGFSLDLDTTNDRLRTYRHDSTGAATLVREYDAQGRNRQLCIGTYGDGSDGDSTTSGPITSNKFFDDWTISASTAVQADNVVICVKDTLTIGANGYIHSNGDSGQDGDEGTPTGGGARPERWFGASGAGGDGGLSGAAGSAGANVGAALGGNGGAGGAGDVGAAGAAGAVTAPTYLPYWLEAILHGQDRDLTGYAGGAGGGGGGGGSGVDAAAGGSGGGILCVVARHLVLNTTATCFRAQGGAGGNGVNSGSGGGGGGGGGLVVLVYQTAEDHNGSQLTQSAVEALISVTGGAGGEEGSGGSAGSAGSAGAYLVFKHG